MKGERRRRRRTWKRTSKNQIVTRLRHTRCGRVLSRPGTSCACLHSGPVVSKAGQCSLLLPGGGARQGWQSGALKPQAFSSDDDRHSAGGPALCDRWQGRAKNKNKRPQSGPAQTGEPAGNVATKCGRAAGASRALRARRKPFVERIWPLSPPAIVPFAPGLSRRFLATGRV